MDIKNCFKCEPKKLILCDKGVFFTVIPENHSFDVKRGYYI